MAFIQGTDTHSASSIGNGAPVSNLEIQVFYTLDSTIAKYDPYDAASTWVRIKGATLAATEKTNQTPYYDQYDEVGVKSGRVESTFDLSQDFYGTSESISKLKNQELWYAEGVQDDRTLLDAENDPIFQEVSFYKAKLIDMTMDKGDLWKINSSGKYNTATKITVIKGLTPVTVAITGTDNAATAATPETYVITGTDLYGATIDMSDISVVGLAGEITSITIEKVSGTPTISVADGADNATKAVTYTGTGECVVRAVIATKNGGTFYSANKTVTVS